MKLGNKMKAVIVKGRAQLDIEDISISEPTDHECLVKIDACAICTGTDTSLIDGNFPFSPEYPFILGHESTGIITKIGKKVKHFKVGQRVTRPSAILFGESANGLYSGWGGFAGYGLVRDVVSAAESGIISNPMLLLSRNTISDDVDPISAALSINQREILSIVRRFRLCSNSKTIVVGSGYNGLLFSLFLKHYGAGLVILIGNPRFSDLAISVFSVDDYINYRDPDLIQICQTKLGSVPTHVIDAVGSKVSLALCRELLSPDTSFGCYGLHDFNETTALRDSLTSSHQPLDMETDEAEVLDEWYALWKDGFFKLIEADNKVMPLEQIKEAIEILAHREEIKIVLII